MGDAMTKIFGGADKSGMKAQRQYNNKILDYIKEQAEGGRSDTLGLWPQAMDQRAGGYQGALDVLGGTIPQQLSTFQQGNVGAQQQLINGMGQYSNAIMGLPVDYSSFQPQTINYDPSFAQQTLPGYGGGGGIDLTGSLGGNVPPGAAGGLGGGGQQGTGGAVNKAGDPSMGFQNGQSSQNWLQQALQGMDNRDQSPSMSQMNQFNGAPPSEGGFWNGIDWQGMGLNMASRLPGMPEQALRAIFGDEAVDAMNSDSTRESTDDGSPNNRAKPSWRPGMARYGSNGSITGGGAFNYATRLGPRPLGKQG